MRLTGSRLGAMVLAGAALLFVGDVEAANFTVNSTAEPGDGTCDASECTLREAVDSLAAVGDQVLFDFSSSGQSAPFEIALDSALNLDQAGAVLDAFVCAGCGTIQASTTAAIDGLDSVLAVRVVASGSFASGALVAISGEDVTLRGLNVDGSPGVGVAVTADGVTIESSYIGTGIDGSAGTGNVSTGVSITAAADVVVGPGNVISGNGAHGIHVVDSDSDDTVIQGNIIGLGPLASVADGNSGVGVYIHGDNGVISQPTIGGPTADDGNVVSGNTSHGILLQDEVDGDTTSFISNNVIGLDGAGAVARGNGGDGIRLFGGTGNGQEPREMSFTDNLIGANTGAGIHLESCKLDVFSSNAIGTDFTGTAQLGNGGDGIYIAGGGPGSQATKQHTIGGPSLENLIAYNGGDGIRLKVNSSGDVRQNIISANSIWENAGIGIDVEAAGVGMGSGDGTTGPAANTCSNSNAWGNREASAPIVATASLLAGVLTVTGTACPGATVDVYTASIDDEPESYQGTGTADGVTGAFAVAVVVASGEGAGEATAVQTQTDGDTGEAAAPVVILAPCDNDSDGVDGTDGGSCTGPDCDDADPSSYPGAPELCDGLDNDCDAVVPSDEIDDDLDGGSECEGDCDDTNAAVNPGAPEICDGLDNDCDGAIPSGETDDDGDGASECAGGDCDDANAAIYPGAPEICDGLDSDCNGVIPADETDDDGDSFDECDDGDCDDTDNTIFPGAVEACDGADSDCDGVVPTDEFDADSDGLFGCEGDCDDTDAAVLPGATEICDGKDSDCDGDLPLDEADEDQDGALICDGSDCDDTNATVYDGAPELCDTIDNDCDGTIDEIEDNDADGFTNCDGDCDDLDPAVFPGAEEICDGKDSNCDSAIGADEVDDDLDGYIECDGGDCDDADDAINIGAEDVCDDGIDQDCDGEDAVCEQPCDDDDLDGDGMSECDGDCDDADASVSPNAPEICGDELDQDCDEADVPCAELSLDDVPAAGCDCEASVAARGGAPYGWALLFGGVLLGRRRRRGPGRPVALAAVAATGLLLGGCAEIGGGTVQTWWGSLPESGGAASFEAGGGFVAGGLAQAVDPALVNGRSVVEVVLGGDRHPLTCDGMTVLQAEFQAVEAALLESLDAGSGAPDLGAWACQELRGVAREVFGGDDWHAVHTLVEPGEDAMARPAAESLLPGVFIGRLVDLSGPSALSPEPGEDGCAARVAARLESGPWDPGFLASSAVSRLEHKNVPAEDLNSTGLGGTVSVGLEFAAGLAGPAQEGEVDVTSFLSAGESAAWDTVVFSTEGEPVTTEPCAAFGLTRHLAWPELAAEPVPGDGEDR
ncbi:MAG: right-handed parallel beta-helix repeat-containing protein [Deltaproteobacteria bacterium]|nr:right-handed parallel beta-helix repeat-containing protein [Deltaproteobacteria bacterium]